MIASLASSHILEIGAACFCRHGNVTILYTQKKYSFLSRSVKHEDAFIYFFLSHRFSVRKLGALKIKTPAIINARLLLFSRVFPCSHFVLVFFAFVSRADSITSPHLLAACRTNTHSSLWGYTIPEPCFLTHEQRGAQEFG